MDGIVLALLQAVEASHAPAMVYSCIRNINASCLATACAQVAFPAFLFIDFDSEQRKFRDNPQHGSYGADGIAIRTSVPPRQYTYYYKGKQGDEECRKALQPHLGFIESVAVGTFCKIGQQVVSPLVNGSKQVVGDSSVGAIRGNQCGNRSESACHQRQEHDQYAITQHVFRFRIRIRKFFLPSSYPRHDVLKDSQRADNGTVNASAHKSKYYKKEDNAGIKCQYSRQELNLSHPSEPCMQCPCKVEEQKRDDAKE